MTQCDEHPLGLVTARPDGKHGEMSENSNYFFIITGITAAVDPVIDQRVDRLIRSSSKGWLS
jgi:hypothetical protein